ncbi:uncharacterized protein TORIP isoform X2 [Periplaneta americana]|uniref:uncharacterized protein TORIP isoform X2 n=1 Tax=Periplaneta americana TaxID=6978 RepID=UPI0037E7CB3F
MKCQDEGSDQLMRTLAKDENLDRRGPRPRRSIHSSEMNRKPPVRRSPRQYQNEKYASAENLTFEDDEVSDDVDEQYREVNVEVKEDPKQINEKLRYGWKYEVIHPDEPLTSRPHLSKSEAAARNYSTSSGHGTQKKHGSHTRNATQQNNLTFNHMIIGLAFAFFIWIVFPIFSGDADNKQNTKFMGSKSEREENLATEIKLIRDEFPSQLKNIWFEFSAGIQKVQENPNRPSVFLLLHETDGETPVCLAQKIANIATQFLNADKPDPLVLDGKDLENNKTLAEDYGTLIEENRLEVEERRTMVVKNLHKVPAVVAQSFHSFCDTVTPLVDRAVYLFTMKTREDYQSVNNPTELAEKELTRLWKKHLSEDILAPLVVRITDTVMFVMPESNLTSCNM